MITRTELRDEFLIERARLIEAGLCCDEDLVEFARYYDWVVADPTYDRSKDKLIKAAKLAKVWMIWLEHGQTAALMWKLAN